MIGKRGFEGEYSLTYKYPLQQKKDQPYRFPRVYRWQGSKYREVDESVIVDNNFDCILYTYSGGWAVTWQNVDSTPQEEASR